MLCFADLKKYKFVYHFGFPALHSDPPWSFGDRPESQSSKASESDRLCLSSEESGALVECVQTWRYLVDSRQYGFFLAKRYQDLCPVKAESPRNHEDSSRTSQKRDPSIKISWDIGSLGQYEHGFFEGVAAEDSFICFADPAADVVYPAWVLRNLLVLVQRRWKLRRVRILCYRESHAKRHEARSIILDLQRLRDVLAEKERADTPATKSASPRITGWERNGGRLTNKVANLGDYMDPKRQVTLRTRSMQAC